MSVRRAITEFEARLLDATVAVREAIDRECGPSGSITSEDPEYARKTALFEDLHAEEAEAWTEVKRERAADAADLASDRLERLYPWNGKRIRDGAVRENLVLLTEEEARQRLQG